MVPDLSRNVNGATATPQRLQKGNPGLSRKPRLLCKGTNEAPEAPSRMNRIGSYAGLLAALWALLVTVIGGAFSPGYSHASQYISELGARGAPFQNIVNFGGFLPTGMAVLVFLIAGRRYLAPSPLSKLGVFLLFGVSAGYTVAAFAPCDPGCPSVGSEVQALHNLGGLLEYLGGSFGLLILGYSYRHLRPQLSIMSIRVAFIVLLSFFLMATMGDLRGLWQRVAEVGLFSWIAYVSVASLRQISETS